MAKIHSSITELVGHTPLVEFKNLEAQNNVNAHLIGKLEYFNPSGSVKDRAALNMIRDAEKKGILKAGGTIVDFTSGNTGIATAAFANALGYKYIVVLQPGVSAERTQILKAYGAELVQCSQVPGFMEMLQTTGLSFKELTKIMNSYAESRGGIYINQGDNPANPEAHYLTTGPELWEDTDGKIDYAVMLVGTGGTLAGVSKYLKEKNPDIKIIGVQPANESLKDPKHPEKNTLDGVLQFHKVPENRVPGFFTDTKWNTLKLVDEVIDVNADVAYQTGRDLLKSDGVFLGQSAAAAVTAAIEIGKRPEAASKNIIIMLADNGFKYLSTNIYK